MPIEFELTAVERQSVSRASQLVRDAGWPDKATRLDDFLRDGNIVSSTDMPSILVAGHASKVKIVLGTTGLDPVDLTRPGDVNTALTRHDPQLLKLAAVLLHEADHTLCHGDIEAYGEMIAFGRYVAGHLNELFNDLTDDEKAAQRRMAGNIEHWGEGGRDRYVERTPPPPPEPAPPPPHHKSGKIKIEDAHVTVPGFGRFRLVPIDRAFDSYPPPVLRDVARKPPKTRKRRRSKSKSGKVRKKR